jgi:hypothetical protein
MAVMPHRPVPRPGRAFDYQCDYGSEDWGFESLERAGKVLFRGYFAQPGSIAEAVPGPQSPHPLRSSPSSPSVISASRSGNKCP